MSGRWEALIWTSGTVDQLLNTWVGGGGVSMASLFTSYCPTLPPYMRVFVKWVYVSDNACDDGNILVDDFWVGGTDDNTSAQHKTCPCKPL